MVLQENVPLAPMTTMGIGGPARYFVDAKDEPTLIEAHQFARRKELPFFVLGGGSNIVVADAGFPGMVVRISIPGRERMPGDDKDSTGRIYRVGAGVDWDQFVDFCVGQNLAGVECLSGIPGSVGGTPIQNVGAYGQEVSSVIRSVRVFDRRAESVRELEKDECGFSYRKSIFNTTERDRYIVLSVTYALHVGGPPTLRYADLERYFRSASLKPSLQDVREAVRKIRRLKAMLYVPEDSNCHSVGSFFKNPIVKRSFLEELQKNYPTVDIPYYPVPNANLPGESPQEAVKIAAAWLIEQAGFPKGFPPESQRKSRVGISSKHTLALINRGGGTAHEILELMREVQSGVEKKFGLRLETEPDFVGFPNQL
ncbi:MAG: UDP-N-acetylmuramate dehydrogenase [Acidobacteriia bacterium]|nr:UDP-N-acetylmuramate dehydrogenase [Terriglobia bacterium]